jgi:hypothetical protein
VIPKEYLEIEKQQRKIIEAAEARIFEARQQADKCPPPKNRRPAKADDIVEGAIIWHERPKEHGGDYWHVVAAPMHYGDAWKAYCADDGCRYGLNGAYVES